MENHIDLLKKYKLKVTPQRLDILELLKKRGHLTVEQLFISIKDKYKNVSLATIYKNVNLFLDSGLLMEVKLNDQKTVYELIKDSHSHLFCKKCADLEDIGTPVNSLDKDINKLSDFKISEMDIIFYGICEKCQKN